MIRAAGLRFGFGGEPVVRDLDLRVDPGRICALLGPSGCGKTTLLRLLAGLLEPQAGTVSRPEPGPGRVAVGLVFQDPRLLPWLTVRQNINFALEAAGVPRALWAERREPLLEKVGLSGAGDARPAALSGGMAQRAALVRTLALRPSCLLLDEPFGALDPMLREQLQEDLQGLLSGAERPSVVVVTHDIGEALVLGDEVLVLGSGCHVRGRVAVAAARPRAAAWRTDAQSLDLERQIRALLAR